MMKQLLVITLAVFVLAVAGISVNASQIFGDDFGGGALGASWTVEQGSASVSSGMLQVNPSTRISLDFGPVVNATPVELRFKYYEIVSSVWDTPWYGMKNTDTGYYYLNRVSCRNDFFGDSGFAYQINPGTGGPDDWALWRSPYAIGMAHGWEQWNYMKYVFNPATGMELHFAVNSSSTLAYDDPSLNYHMVAAWNIFDIQSLNQWWFQSENNNSYLIDDIQAYGTAVPEPGSLLALGMGFAGVVGLRRKMK